MRIANSKSEIYRFVASGKKPHDVVLYESCADSMCIRTCFRLPVYGHQGQVGAGGCGDSWAMAMISFQLRALVLLTDNDHALGNEGGTVGSVDLGRRDLIATPAANPAGLLVALCGF
jgi:hypothetical protein